MTTGKSEPGDSLWTDFQAEPPEAVDGSSLASGSSQPQPSKSKSVALGFATTIGLLVLCILLRRLYGEFGPSSVGLAVMAMLLGALQGFFLARGPISVRLMSSGVSLLWVIGAASWKASRAPWPESAILTILPIFFVSALLPGCLAFFAVTLFPERFGRVKSDSTRRTQGLVLSTPAPLQVIYDVLPDPQEAPLRERLLELCNQDRAIVDRLVAHEQAQNPQDGVVEHLRLAIARFERDRE